MVPIFVYEKSRTPLLEQPVEPDKRPEWVQVLTMPIFVYNKSKPPPHKVGY